MNEIASVKRAKILIIMVDAQGKFTILYTYVLN